MPDARLGPAWTLRSSFLWYGTHYDWYNFLTWVKQLHIAKHRLFRSNVSSDSAQCILLQKADDLPFLSSDRIWFLQKHETVIMSLARLRSKVPVDSEKRHYPSGRTLPSKATSTAGPPSSAAQIINFSELCMLGDTNPEQLYAIPSENQTFAGTVSTICIQSSIPSLLLQVS